VFLCGGACAAALLLQELIAAFALASASGQEEQEAVAATPDTPFPNPTRIRDESDYSTDEEASFARGTEPALVSGPQRTAALGIPMGTGSCAAPAWCCSCRLLQCGGCRA
jgi:hypothetical protein